MEYLLIALLFANAAYGLSSKKEEDRTLSQTHIQTVSAAESVWITRPDGAQSCQPGSGTTLEDDAQELKTAQIPVLESKKGSDGMMHIQMCGAPKGSTNSFLIPKDKLAQALTLGYRELRLKK